MSMRFAETTSGELYAAEVPAAKATVSPAMRPLVTGMALIAKPEVSAVVPS